MAVGLEDKPVGSQISLSSESSDLQILKEKQSALEIEVKRKMLEMVEDLKRQFERENIEAAKKQEMIR